MHPADSPRFCYRRDIRIIRKFWSQKLFICLILDADSPFDKLKHEPLRKVFNKALSLCDELLRPRCA